MVVLSDNNSFDAALAVLVFHLMAEPEKAIGELRRVLKPGAFFIHCLDRAVSGMEKLWAAWSELSDRQGKRRDWWEHSHQLLLNAGWQQVGDERDYPYDFPQSPQQFLDRIEQRISPFTWNMSADKLAAGVARMKAAIAKHYDDPKTPIDLPAVFRIRVYQPLT